MRDGLRVVRMVDEATIPTRSYHNDLGYDLYASTTVRIPPKQHQLISTGIQVSFPRGYGAFIKDRSSVSTQRGLFTHAGVIDGDYRGEIKILVQNSTDTTQTIYSGDKIAQLVLIPIVDVPIIEVVSFDEETMRGEKGFGSTGA